MAYLDNQEIWLELLQTDVNEKPSWLSYVTGSNIRFNGVMRRLQDYSLIEAHPEKKAFSLHSCVHDWSLEYLNSEVDEGLYCLAVRCVSNLVVPETEPTYWQRDQRLEPHAIRLRHCRFQELLSGYSGARLIGSVEDLGELFRRRGRLFDAEEMYGRALAGYEKALGPDHTSTLDTVNNLGNLYKNQDKLGEAEEMYGRALAGYEKTLGHGHWKTQQARYIISTKKS